MCKTEKNPQKLAAKLEPVGNVDESQLYDAVVSAARWLAKQPLSPAARRVLFLFSDGQDNASKSDLRQATEALQLARIPILIVAPSSVENKKGGKLYVSSPVTVVEKYISCLVIPDRRASNSSSATWSRSLLTLDVSSFQSGRLQLTVSKTTNPQISVIAPPQIFR
jgi:hypothetical protein